MKEDYACMKPVCSKLVDLTSWSVLAMNKEDNSFSQSRQIFFTSGAQYGRIYYSAFKSQA
jgi:hypothetical protein